MSGISYDARGLAEPNAEAPGTATIDDAGIATFDAKDMTTRLINLELRRLIYEEGVTDVVVQNPQGRHSLGVGILARCRITFEGSLGYFGCGLIDGPEIHIKGRVGWSSCENMMSGVVVVHSNAGSLTGAAMRGGDLVVKGRVGARTGIDQKGGTIIVCGDAGSMNGFMMQRGRQIFLGNVGPGLGDSMYDGTIYVGGTVKSLGIDCVPGEWTDADTEFIERKFSDLRARLPARAPEVRVREGPLQLRLARAFREEARDLRSADVRRRTRNERGPRAEPDLHARGRQRHPHEGRARPLPHARVLDLQEDPALGRARLPPRHAHALRHRGLPGEVRHDDRPRRPLREEADRARHPDLHHGDELRRAVARGEDGAREGRLDGRHGDVLGRGRDDPARARLLDQVVLPVHPEPVRVQPAPPDARGRRRVLHRPGLQGRARRAPDGTEGDRAGRRDALAAGGNRPALACAPSRLARAGRPLAEDPGDPRGDRLPGPDPAQARRVARLRRRAHGRQVRAGHHLPRRGRGRHRGGTRTSRPRRRASR